MNKAAALISVIVALWVGATLPSHASGRNLVFKNPNPDRTWTTQVGGILTPAKSYALVISISDYIGMESGGYPKLDTHNDADKMKDFLLQDLGFDYVRQITDTEVTKANIEAVMLDELRKLVGEHDRFVFYWSGHGDQLVRADKSSTFGFLPLYDSKRGQFSSMIGMEDIARWNGYLDARHALFILDSCLSGLAGVSKKSNPRLDQLSLPARYLLTAGAANEEVIAGDRWGGSLFTDSLIKVVREHAQPQGATVSIFRIFDEVQERVAVERQKMHWSKPLTPQLRNLQGGDGAFFFVAKSSPVATAELNTKPVIAEKGPALPGGSVDFAAKFPASDAKSPVENLDTSRTATPSEAALTTVPTQIPTAATSSALNHCRNRTEPERRVFSTNASTPSLKVDDALQKQLGRPIEYENVRGTWHQSKSYDLPNLLRGSFKGFEFGIKKCNGKSRITIDGAADSFSKKTATVYAYKYQSAGVGDPRCVHNEEFYDLEEAFHAVLADLHSSQRPITAYDTKGNRYTYVQLKDSILGFATILERFTEEPASSSTLFSATCTDYFIHAVNGYQ